MSDLELQTILLVGYGYRPERDVFGDLHWHVGNPMPRPNPMNEGNYDVCLSCGGDGGFDDTYIGRDHEVHSDYRECRECEGTGHVFHE